MGGNSRFSRNGALGASAVVVAALALALPVSCEMIFGTSLGSMLARAEYDLAGLTTAELVAEADGCSDPALAAALLAALNADIAGGALSGAALTEARQAAFDMFVVSANIGSVVMDFLDLAMISGTLDPAELLARVDALIKDVPLSADALAAVNGVPAVDDPDWPGHYYVFAALALVADDVQTNDNYGPLYDPPAAAANLMTVGTGKLSDPSVANALAALLNP